MPREEVGPTGAGNFLDHIALALAIRQVDEVEVYRVFSGCLPALLRSEQPTKPLGDRRDKTVVAGKEANCIFEFGGKI